MYRIPPARWSLCQFYRRRQCRGFATTRTVAMTAGGPIQFTAEIIQTIHDFSGLPYGYTIPLTAVILRTIVTLPFAIQSQKKLNRRIELRPLFHQWGEIIGMRSVARQKNQNVDIRENQQALEETMSTVKKLVNIT